MAQASNPRSYQATVHINSPQEDVFDFFADMTRLPEWAAEDFISVTHEGNARIGKGSRFKFVTRGAKAQSTFIWESFERPRDLVFYGPRLDVGMGWVEGRGGYTFARAGGGTDATAWYQPRFGGLLRLMAPFARLRNARLLPAQLARAKALIEETTTPPAQSR